MADTFFGFNTSLTVSTLFVCCMAFIVMYEWSHFYLMTPKVKHMNENNGFVLKIIFIPPTVK